MGLYASYYPISPNTLNNFIASVHSKDFWKVMYAVRGHEFPAPDGSVRLEPHLPSYSDEHWQGYTYVTAEEAETIAKYLQLIDESEFEARFLPRKMKGVYRRPMSAEEI